MNIIAVDAMGGDHAPRAVVEGAILAAQHGIAVTLFGDQEALLSILAESTQSHKLPITVVHCAEQIAMDEEPSRAVIRKNDSSLVQAIKAVKSGAAQACVSAGNSGAVLAAATLLLERISGILRPALGGFLPAQKGHIFCMDLGANTDCKVEYLKQFALMGHVYLQVVKNIDRPRIALLSNGHEPYKGSQLVKATYELLTKTSLNFVGNVEARAIFDAEVDVIVCDGFVGNVMLKTAQATIATVVNFFKDEARKSLLSRLALVCAMPLLKKLGNKTDYAKVGGVLLLGITEPVVVAHGSSSAQAIAQAIIFADTVVREHRIKRFNVALMELLRQVGPTAAASKTVSFAQL